MSFKTTAPLPAGSVTTAMLTARGRLRLAPDAVRAARPSARHDPATQRRRESNGKIGEAVAEILHDVCRRCGVADVAKVPTAMAIKGPDPRERPERGVFLARFARRVGVDYRGLLLDGSGRGVYSEVKFVEDDGGAFYLASMRPDQRAQLETAMAAGAVAVLVVVRGRRREVFALPWRVARAHAALHTRELDPWRVRAGEPYLAHWIRKGTGR